MLPLSSRPNHMSSQVLQRRVGRVVGLAGIFIGAPLIALASCAMAFADPDQLFRVTDSNEGPALGAFSIGSDVITGRFYDTDNVSAGINRDGFVGDWFEEKDDLGLIQIVSQDDGYRWYVNGVNTNNDYIQENSINLEIPATGSGSLFGNDLLLEYNYPGGQLVGLEDSITIFGFDVTLVDALTSH